MTVLQKRYQLLRKLSAKPGRRTLLATDLMTQKAVVIKILLFDENFQWANLKLFEREAQTLKALNHPAIPRYIDYFDLDLSGKKGFALVQSYIAAQSLEAHVRAGRIFSEAELTKLAKALLEILVYLHEHLPPVVHRDLKPSNILLSTHTDQSIESVSLVDFGSVQTAPTSSSTYTVVGTYGYMPPEQFAGLSTPRSDLYSFGATLVYLITSKHPADLTTHDLKIQFKPPSSLHPALIDLVQWLTEPSPEQRPNTAQLALDHLNKRQRRPQRNHVASSEIFWNAGWRTFAILMLLRPLVLWVGAMQDVPRGFLISQAQMINLYFSRLFGTLGSSLFISIVMGVVFYILTQRFVASQASNFSTYRRQLAGSSIAVFVVVGIVFDLMTGFLTRIPSFFFLVEYFGFSLLLSLSMVWMSGLFADWFKQRQQRET